MTQDVLIKTEDLWKTYDMGSTEVHALQGVSFSIDRNEYVAIMGPSGSGKSTLMNLIGCLDTPTNGRYWLNRKLVSEMDDDELAHIRNKEIGFVFQTFNLLARATALHNVELPLIYSGMVSKERTERAKSALSMVELSDRMHHKPNELSGGQRQRVAIARALAMAPEVVLFDEATSALDPELVGEVLAVIRKLTEEGMTMVVVTHEMEFAREVATDVTFMDAGVVVEQGPTERMLSHVTSPRLEQFLRRYRR
jgi:putative ABC transport system ATP-binding protein